ncbi:MAG: TetR/AcrR family transcriptional regulator [Acidimicrobiales bacterium]
MANTTSRPSPPRGRTSGGRRKELLEIAARVFAQKGIAAATVRDIAQEAGILSGSLYHHFASKEEMVAEIIADGPARIYGDRDTVLALAAEDAAKTMRACILDAVTWVAHNPDIARILRNDAQYVKETPALADAEANRQANRLLWIGVVEHGITNRQFRPDLDADVAVRAMWDGVLAAIRWFPPLGHEDPSVIASKLADLYLGGMSIGGS